MRSCPFSGDSKAVSIVACGVQHNAHSSGSLPGRIILAVGGSHVAGELIVRVLRAILLVLRTRQTIALLPCYGVLMSSRSVGLW